MDWGRLRRRLQEDIDVKLEKMAFKVKVFTDLRLKEVNDLAKKTPCGSPTQTDWRGFTGFLSAVS